MRRSEASGVKGSFSRIMDLTCRTLLVDFFVFFFTILSPTSVHISSHLAYAMVDEECIKLKNGVCHGAGKNQVALLGFPQP